MLDSCVCEANSQVLLTKARRIEPPKVSAKTLCVPSFSGKTLVIEDDDNQRLILELLLKEYCDEIVTTDNAEEGLKCLVKDASDVSLVLSDIELPNMSGIEFLKKIKSNKRLSNIPVILQSGIACIYKESGLDFTNVGFLQKPYSKGDLYSEINQILSIRGKNGY